MLKFLKRKKNVEDHEPPIETNNSGWFSKLKQGLAKTRGHFTKNIAALLLGKKELSADLLNDIETILLTADIGVNTTEHLIQTLTQQLARKQLNDSEAALNILQHEMKQILLPCEKPLLIPDTIKPYIILVIGINGSGKTTTIGKLAKQFKENNQTVILAAGDTFRAAATEQLQVWGERNDIPVVTQQAGADPAAVIFDACSAAKARGVDVVIADTAGRLHTQSNLMEELKKIKRVIGKVDPTAPHEVLLVLDATLGQNTLNQVKQFNQALQVTGLVLTKLDGTAKGGILFAIAKETQIPIRFIGVGEGLHDLRSFQAEAFVQALFSE